MDKILIGTAEIAFLRNVTRQTAQRWCSEGWLKTARMERLGKLRCWTVERDEVMDFVPPKPGPKVKGKPANE